MAKIDNLFARISESPNLPSPPAIAFKILGQAKHPQCTIQEIAQTIQYDPAMCGKVLRMINSALFSMNQPITSITRALHLLGLKRIQLLVLGLSLPGLADSSLPTKPMQDFWKTAVTRGIVAQELARLKGSSDPDTEFIVGLMCDIGTLILQQVFPAEYSTGVLSNSPEVLALKQCELEEQQFGHDHAQVGAFILNHWHLPEEIVEAVRYHHCPQQAPASNSQAVDRAHLLFFAQGIAQLQVISGRPSLLEKVFTLAGKHYHLQPAQLMDLLQSLNEKTKEYAALLEIPIGIINDLPLPGGTQKAPQVAGRQPNSSPDEGNHVEKDLTRNAKALHHAAEEPSRRAQKMEAPGRAAKGVAHDFNNLLTIIKGYSEILLATLPPTDPSYVLIAEIKNASDRATDLMPQLVSIGVAAPWTKARGSETILLAEDEDGVRKIARLVLERNGYHVLEASNGWEALNLSDQHQGPIHLLLTDTIMPHMGGCELAHRLTQKRNGIRVLYTSGYSDEVMIRDGILSAGNVLLQKPYSPETLVGKVREVLN